MTEQFPQVIARAFDDEPVVLYAHALQETDRHVNVSRDGAAAKIGWPITDAFDYDVDDFTKLHVAFCENDIGELKRFYAELRSRPRRYVEILRQRGTANG